MRSYKHLAVRSDRGYIIAPAASFSTGIVRDGDTSLSDDEIIAVAMGILAKRMMNGGPVLANPGTTRDYLRLRLADLQHEVFACVWLDNRHRVIAFEELFRGTIDGASVHAREVVKRCLKHNAAAVIFAHNHPSALAEPSRADEMITRRLKAALELIEVRVLDHIIVGGTNVESFAERGLL